MPQEQITVTISRFGHDPQVLTVPEGSSVAEVLQASHIELTGREEAFVEGEKALPADTLEDGDIVSIVTPKQAG